MLRKMSMLMCLLCAFTLSPHIQSSLAAQGYTLTDLGSLGPPGSGNSLAYGISASGLVTGSSYDGVTQTRVFLYSGGVMHSLGRFDYITIGRSINDSGQIAGDVIVEGVNTFTPHAFLFRNGVFTDLGTLPGFNRSAATGINAAGQVAVSMYNFGTGSSLAHAFLWQNGVFTDLGMLPGYTSAGATGINDSAQIVGAADTSAGIMHAFLWQNGVMTDLGTLGGANSQANAINNNGQVVGWSATTSSAEHPFLWQNGGMTDLGVLPGFGYGTAQAINLGGQIVGTASTAGPQSISHAFLYRRGVLSDLNTLIYGNPGITLQDAEGIDHTGHIIVNGQVNFVDHAFLLTPHTPTTIPSPPTGLAATAGRASVQLNWNPSAEALSYNVKRSLVSGGPYTKIGVVLSGPGFTDTTVTTGKTYFYVVSGVNAHGQSANSKQVQATPQ